VSILHDIGQTFVLPQCEAMIADETKPTKISFNEATKEIININIRYPLKYENLYIKFIYNRIID